MRNQKINSHLKTELDILLKSILSAGIAVETVRKKGITTTYKENTSPLTDADLLANDILKTNLLSHFPNDAWLSEETADDTSRLLKQRVWIVDPIDGTKEFVKNIPEYAISVALVENNIAILSAILNPAREELFYAIRNQGAWFNHHPIHMQSKKNAPLTFLASRTEVKDGYWDQFKQNHEIEIIGSIAYKLALIAKGIDLATISFAPKSEWDIAAGVLLVTEAGGKVTDLKGKNIIFNQKNILINGLIAANKEDFAAVYAEIR